ncbi:hypothetical protein [Microvirga massiliensis]|uniref:hypothetical protein n=1 Tax=Microvirga massiliensis TaxID=1033741 RepID=UPI00069DCCC9|nr:hypothetical protein [Microvirga massiliensis]
MRKISTLAVATLLGGIITSTDAEATYWGYGYPVYPAPVVYAAPAYYPPYWGGYGYPYYRRAYVARPIYRPYWGGYYGRPYWRGAYWGRPYWGGGYWGGRGYYGRW